MKKILFTLSALLLAVPAIAADFNHVDHLEYADSDCTVCHVSNADSIVPAKSVCLECHDSDFVEGASIASPATHQAGWVNDHARKARMGGFNCASCHDDQQKDCMECHTSGFANEMGSFSNSKSNVHRADFTVGHPLQAKQNPNLCATCHVAEKDCASCHAKFNAEDLAPESHRKTFSSLKAGSYFEHKQFSDNMCQTCHPDSIVPTHEWSKDHAREARRDLMSCQSCHTDGDTCMKCHSAKSGLGVNPHPADWDKIKNNIKDVTNGGTCRKCH